MAFENIPGHLLHGLRLCRSRLSYLRRKLHQQVFFHMTLKFFKCTFSRTWFPMPAFPNNTESLVIIIMVMIELKRPKINRSAGKFLKLWLMAGLLWEFLMLSKTLCAWGGVWVWRSRMCQRPRLPPWLWNLDHYPQHPAAFMTSNPNFLGLQCVISASLPYCTDIDECHDARPAFNKAAHCGDHAVVFWFLTGIAAICSGLREHYWEFLLHLPGRISEPLHDVWLLGYWRVSEYILINCFVARIINSNVKAQARQQQVFP